MRILRPAEAADYLRLAPITLAKMRAEGTGPRFIRLGPRSIRYDQDALDEYIRARAVSDAPEPEADEERAR